MTPEIVNHSGLCQFLSSRQPAVRFKTMSRPCSTGIVPFHNQFSPRPPVAIAAHPFPTLAEFYIWMNTLLQSCQPLLTTNESQSHGLHCSSVQLLFEVHKEPQLNIMRQKFSQEAIQPASPCIFGSQRSQRERRSNPSRGSLGCRGSADITLEGDQKEED